MSRVTAGRMYAPKPVPVYPMSNAPTIEDDYNRFVDVRILDEDH